tara:strand:+ start:610 stop:774 length:165 start_codon:yes stop_codon:yes gene_type:complete
MIKYQVNERIDQAIERKNNEKEAHITRFTEEKLDRVLSEKNNFKSLHLSSHLEP